MWIYCLLSLTVSSCGLFVPRNVERLPDDADGDAKPVTSDRIQSQILTPYCVSCHHSRPGGQFPDLTDIENSRTKVDFAGVVEPGDPERSQLYLQVRDGLMPPPPNPRPAINATDLIREWIVGLKTLRLTFQEAEQ